MACQGMLRSLNHLPLAPDAALPMSKRWPGGVPSVPGDGAFVNVLANIVLRIQAEASHVY
jgi:hypothetical protein